MGREMGTMPARAREHQKLEGAWAGFPQSLQKEAADCERKVSVV